MQKLDGDIIINISNISLVFIFIFTVFCLPDCYLVLYHLGYMYVQSTMVMSSTPTT